jgi:hypothetical protein
VLCNSLFCYDTLQICMQLQPGTVPFYTRLPTAGHPSLRLA